MKVAMRDAASIGPGARTPSKTSAEVRTYVTRRRGHRGPGPLVLPICERTTACIAGAGAMSDAARRLQPGTLSRTARRRRRAGIPAGGRNRKESLCPG